MSNKFDLIERHVILPFLAEIIQQRFPIEQDAELHRLMVDELRSDLDRDLVDEIASTISADEIATFEALELAGASESEQIAFIRDRHPELTARVLGVMQDIRMYYSEEVR